MKVRSLSKVSAFAVLALTLAFMVPATATPKLSLQTQFLSQPVQLFPWQTTITLAFDNPICPGNSGFDPSLHSVTIGGLNFTENLSGRDVGSTWLQFKSFNSPGVFLFKTSDLSSTVLVEFICTVQFSGSVRPSSDLLTKAQLVFLSLMGSWRVPASGTYALLFTPPPPVQPLVANETWTATTIS